MEPLDPARRRALRAKAHHLDPVVTIGHHGLTPAVRHEIDVALTAHELVKVRVLGDDREARETLLAEICRELDCAPVQQIGKLLVLFRPRSAPTVAKHSPDSLERALAVAEAVGTRKPAATKRRVARPPGRALAPVRPGPRPAFHGAGAGKPPATSTAPRAPRGVPRAALPRRRRGV